MTARDRSEAELTEQVRSGCDPDGVAIEELYRRHAPVALRVAHRLSARLGVAEDVAAEAFLRTWQRLVAGHPVESFRGYLLQAVRNAHIDVMRRHARLVSLDNTPEGELRSEVSSLTPGVDAMATREQLHSAWSKVNPRYRQVLWLSVVEGYPLEEVAFVLGVTRSNAAVVLHRARRALRNAYGAALDTRVA